MQCRVGSARRPGSARGPAQAAVHSWMSASKPACRARDPTKNRSGDGIEPSAGTEACSLGPGGLGSSDGARSPLPRCRSLAARTGSISQVWRSHGTGIWLGRRGPGERSAAASGSTTTICAAGPPGRSETPTSGALSGSGTKPDLTACGGTTHTRSRCWTTTATRSNTEAGANAAGSSGCASCGKPTWDLGVRPRPARASHTARSTGWSESIQPSPERARRIRFASNKRRVAAALAVRTRLSL